MKQRGPKMRESRVFALPVWAMQPATVTVLAHSLAEARMLVRQGNGDYDIAATARRTVYRFRRVRREE